MSAELINERRKTHGDYAAVAHIIETIIGELQTGPRWFRMTPVQRLSLHMIAHKIARIATGNPDERDHWRDIAGYATLAGDSINDDHI